MWSNIRKLVVRTSKKPTPAMKLLAEQKQRIFKAHEEMKIAEEHFKTADPDYMDIAILRWKLTMDRVNMEHELYKKLEGELFHERVHSETTYL